MRRRFGKSDLPIQGCLILFGATPVFADIAPKTFNLDPAQIEALVSPRAKAIVPVHLFGQPADMDPILEAARRHGLAVVEDNAQGVASEYSEYKEQSEDEEVTHTRERFAFFAVEPGPIEAVPPALAGIASAAAQTGGQPADGAASTRAHAGAVEIPAHRFYRPTTPTLRYYDHQPVSAYRRHPRSN